MNCLVNKKIELKCNEDSVIYCPVTSQALKIHSHLSFFDENIYWLVAKYNKRRIPEISFLKMEKK